MHISKIALPTVISAIVIASPIAAQAQALEEIIVTAQKREESVQDVPIAIQAYTGEEIRNLRVSRASDITKLAPNINLSTQNTASRQINIRGGLTDEGMLLVGHIHNVANGKTAPFRGLWTPLEDGRVRQFFEQSNDGGKTWQTWFDGYYTRIDEVKDTN